MSDPTMKEWEAYHRKRAERTRAMIKEMEKGFRKVTEMTRVTPKDRLTEYIL